MIRIGLLLSVVLFAACGDTPTGLAHERRAAMERAFGAADLVWFRPDAAGAWTMRPLLDGTRVFFERDGFMEPSELMALDRATGDVIWRNEIIAAKSAAVAHGRVGAVWGSLPLFDAATGAPHATFRVSGTPLNSNVVSGGTHFFVGTHDGRVAAVDPDAAAAWETALSGGRSTSVFGITLSDGALAVTLKHFPTAPAAPDSGIVAVLEPADGGLRWRVALGAPQGGAGTTLDPVITAGLVIAGTQMHDVRAFDIASGELRWHRNVAFRTQPWASSGMAGCDGRVIVATGDLGLIALDAATGETVWRLPDLGDGSLRYIDCSHGTVLALATKLMVFDAATGATRAVYPRRDPHVPGEFFIASVVRDADALYVGTNLGFVKVLAP